MAFDALKAKQSTAWSSAPYERVSAQHLAVLEDLVDRLDVRAGERLLDVATGTGETARIAARRGLHVTGLDFAKTLLETARLQAEEEGLDVRYDDGDAEALPYPDSSFDVVTSTFGVIFAPDQGQAAAELARVTVPGGRLGLTVWTSGGGVAQMFAVLKHYLAPPPEGAGSPFAWGSQDRLQELLGDAFDLNVTEDVVLQTGPSGDAMWELMAGSYGPTKALADGLDSESRDRLHREFAAFFDKYATGAGVALPREYLRVIGRRRS